MCVCVCVCVCVCMCRGGGRVGEGFDKYKKKYTLRYQASNI